MAKCSDNGNENKSNDQSDEEDKDCYNLVVRNIPRPSYNSKQSLKNWVAKVTGERKVNVTYSGTSHFIHFDDASIGLEEMIDLLKNTPFNDLVLDVDEAKIIKRLHVSNLKEDVTEDEIILYFEQPQFRPTRISAGEDYFVTVQHLDKKKKFAFVKLPENADMHLYVNATHSDILGENIKVSEGQANRKPRQQQRNRRNEKNRTYKKSGQHATRDLGGSVEVLATRSANRKMFSDKNIRSNRESRDHSAERCRPDHRRSGMGDYQLNINVNKALKGLNLKHPYKEHQQHLFYNKQQHIHKHHIPNQQPLKKIDADYKKLFEECQIKMMIRLDDEQDKEKRELLRKFLRTLANQLGSDWKIWIDFSSPEIHIGHMHDEQKLQKVMDHIKELLSSMVSCDVHLPQSLTDGCFMHFNLIKMYLIEFLDRNNVQAVAYLNLSTNMLSIIAENKETATRAAKLLEEDYEDKYITVRGDQDVLPIQNFLMSKWDKFIRDLSNKFLVNVNVQTDDTDSVLISLTGFRSDRGFRRAIDEIRKEINSMGGCIVSVVGESEDDNVHSNERRSRECRPVRTFHPHHLDNKRINSARNIPKNNEVTHKDCNRTQGNKNKSKRDADNKNASSVDGANKVSAHKEKTKSIKMSTLEFRYLKQGLPNIINDKVHYNSMESCLEIIGSEEDFDEKKKIIEDTVSSFVKKNLLYTLPGITVSFYKEQNSSFKSLLTCLEKDKKCVFDVAPNEADNKRKCPGIIIQCICSFSHINSIEDALTNALKKMVDEKSVSYSFILKHRSEASRKVNRSLDKRLAQEISHQANENISIEIDEKSESILLRGRKMYVSKAETFINNLFLEFLKKTPVVQEENTSSLLTLEDPLRMIHPSEFLKSYAHQDIQAPPHWVTYQGSLKTVSNIKGHLNELDSHSPLYNIISSMVHDSWSEDGTFVFDANSSKNCIKITKIYSVENVCQYKRYMMKIKEFCLQHHDQAAELSRQTQSILTRRITDSEPLLLREINECYLFHGTDRNNKQAIVDQGLDFRLGSSHSLFGKGIYFAESCTKAHYYADAKTYQDITDEPLCMFVARVFLGHMYHCDTSRPFKRPPCMDASCTSDTCQHHARYDSVMGTNSYNERMNKCIALRKKRDNMMMSTDFSPYRSLELKEVNDELKKLSKYLFREFIVYDQSQCYPDFLVEYVKL